jgi:hypothetical protein
VVRGPAIPLKRQRLLGPFGNEAGSGDEHGALAPGHRVIGNDVIALCGCGGWFQQGISFAVVEPLRKCGVIGIVFGGLKLLN